MFQCNSIHQALVLRPNCVPDKVSVNQKDVYQKRNTHTLLPLRYTPLLTVECVLKCDGTRAETRFRLPEKRTSPFKSAGVSVQSTTGSRGVRISDSNAGYTMFRGSVKSTGYPLLSPVSPSLPLPCITVCHHNSIGFYQTPSFMGFSIGFPGIQSLWVPRHHKFVFSISQVYYL